MRRVRYNDLPDLCTVPEVGAYLHISRNAAYDLVKRGVIPSVRFGKLIRVPKASLPKGASLPAATPAPDPARDQKMAAALVTVEQELDQLRMVMRAFRRHFKNASD